MDKNRQQRMSKRQRSDCRDDDDESAAAKFHRRRLSRFTPSRRFHEDLPIEWWERSQDCKDAKSRHMERVDSICSSREDLVFLTTLWEDDTVLEPNMFPYDTPPGVEHFTLWSVLDLQHNEIVTFVDKWLSQNMPQVRRWQYDDNSGERSFHIFHVHVFIETVPFSFVADPEFEYIPPHMEHQQPEHAKSKSIYNAGVSDCASELSMAGNSADTLRGNGHFDLLMSRSFGPSGRCPSPRQVSSSPPPLLHSLGPSPTDSPFHSIADDDSKAFASASTGSSPYAVDDFGRDLTLKIKCAQVEADAP